MRKITLVCLLMLFTLALGHRTLAQDASAAPQAAKPPAAAQAAPEHYYHLDFVIEELGSDGKPVNSRAYSTTVCTQRRSPMSIRAGSRIPIATGSNFQYEDVGTNFDVGNAHEVDRQLAFDLTATVSAVAESSEPNAHPPVIRNNRWEASVLVSIGKSTVVFTSDSIDNKGSTRVLVTATPIQ